MFKQLISLATASGTLFSMFLLGNKDKRGWIVGLLNQLLWATFIVAFGAWGLAPLSVCLLFMYTRNLLKWRREEAEESYPSQILYSNDEDRWDSWVSDGLA